MNSVQGGMLEGEVPSGPPQASAAAVWSGSSTGGTPLSALLICLCRLPDAASETPVEMLHMPAVILNRTEQIRSQTAYVGECTCKGLDMVVEQALWCVVFGVVVCFLLQAAKQNTVLSNTLTCIDSYSLRTAEPAVVKGPLAN